MRDAKKRRFAAKCSLNIDELVGSAIALVTFICDVHL
jgi:hypothetical protein